MASVKRDDVKQKWEETEFPLVCETCLGDNPYVRMTKETHGKKCKICDTPFTVFAWQAGTKGRLKKVEICKTCAQAKNVCQVCIYDLQYGLPVAVRDKILREGGGGGGGGGSSALQNVPQSKANRSWYTAQQERALEQGQDLNNPTCTLAHAKLADMARMEPRYERNLPKLCSFYAKGECNRGSKCPFRHEMPRDRNDPLAKQNTKDRFYGTQDPVAGKLIARQKRREEQSQQGKDGKDGSTTKRGDQGYDERAKATLYVRFSDRGPRGTMNTTPTTPETPLPKMTETMIRDSFYSFGEIVAVRLHPSSNGAFVEYTQSQATELAIASMNRKSWGQGYPPLFVAWARAPKRGNTVEGGSGPSQSSRSQGPQSSSSEGATAAIRPVPPPRNQHTNTLPPSATTTTRSPPLPAGLVPAPRPGGGVIRGGGAAAAKRSMRGGHHNSQPYYPSADPSRLGTNTTTTTTPSSD